MKKKNTHRHSFARFRTQTDVILLHFLKHREKCCSENVTIQVIELFGRRSYAGSLFAKLLQNAVIKSTQLMR